MTKENTENCFFILLVLFLPNIHGTKGMINAVPLFSFFFIYSFIGYITIYSYVSLFMRLSEIIRTLILFFIMLHIHGVVTATERYISATFAEISFLIMNCA